MWVCLKILKLFLIPVSKFKSLSQWTTITRDTNNFLKQVIWSPDAQRPKWFYPRDSWIHGEAPLWAQWLPGLHSDAHRFSTLYIRSLLVVLQPNSRAPATNIKLEICKKPGSNTMLEKCKFGMQFYLEGKVSRVNGRVNVIENGSGWLFSREIGYLF